MHEKRRQRGTPDDQDPQERLSPFGRLLQATIELVDTDSENDVAWARAQARVRTAATVYARWIGVPKQNAPERATARVKGVRARRAG